MVRSYKRDLRGRFAGAVAGHAAKKQVAQNYRVAKATNRQRGAQAVKMGLLTKKQAKSAVKVANRKAKANHKAAVQGLKVKR